MWQGIEAMRLAIGDIHGRQYWKRYLKEDFSAFYVVGDYFDNPAVSFFRQYRNFIEICKAARRDPRIQLCLGNHDYHYLAQVSGQRYSGFQDRNWPAISEIFEHNIDLFKILYVTDDNYIISHAGLSATFMQKMNDIGVDTVAGINEAFLRDRNILNFDGYNFYGDDPTQSPIWIRPRSLCSDPLAGYNQIVGHTPMSEIKELSVTGPADAHQSIRITFINTETVDLVYRF